MTGKTHVAIGVATALTLSLDKSPENLIILVLASSLGSLVPDLDHPKAKLNQKLLWKNNKIYKTLFFIALGSIFMFLYFSKNIKPLLIISVVFFLLGISSHRGFTHSILGFLASIYMVRIGTLKYNLPFIYYGFMLGYILHLVADFFTPMGIKLFYPLNVNVSSPITIRTNSKTEKIIFMLLSVYSIFLMFRYLVTLKI